MLTGHHRNYSPIMTKAREIVESGVLGRLVGVCGTALFYKRRRLLRRWRWMATRAGGGPILLNLTHEVNNLLSLIGDIDTVMAMTSNSTRGFPVEDTAAMIFRFANGALGTFLLSDTVGSARSRSRPPKRTPATPAMTTRTRITSPERRVRCRCPRCA